MFNSPPVVVVDHHFELVPPRHRVGGEEAAVHAVPSGNIRIWKKSNRKLILFNYFMGNVLHTSVPVVPEAKRPCVRHRPVLRPHRHLHLHHSVQNGAL